MSTTDDAFAYCERMAKAHYENFPVGSFLIPSDKRKYVWAVYAFARTADDFADEGRNPGESPDDLKKRLDALDDWEFKLTRAARGDADHPAFIAVAETFSRLGIPFQLLNDLLTAYRMDVTQRRYASFQDVFFYCRHSANPVGRLVLHIMGYKDESLHLLSDKICTALQLANFWQDIAVDLAKDRIYIPQEEMKKFHVTEGDLHAQIINRSFKTLVRYLCDRTASLFDEGLPLCSRVGRDLKLEMRLTWLGGTDILKKIHEADYDVFRRRPVIGGLDKVRLLARAFWPLPLKPLRER